MRTLIVFMLLVGVALGGDVYNPGDIVCMSSFLGDVEVEIIEYLPSGSGFGDQPRYKVKVLNYEPNVIATPWASSVYLCQPQN